ncbi:MAG TPA: bifunctional hydroxymethylpyrimidine kinase/phosphomethylpyrimidine kinase [Terriglobales bacterium]|nr:bifunctional hydroxymethylpyrimidine kinase/phosphomethylpyrimidine kinase [Terriglobales bacterium]
MPGPQPSRPKPSLVLTIAGFDPSSGAGTTADLKTIAAHGLYGLACITALTVQSTQGVRRVEPLRGELVRETLEALFEDSPPDAVKIGMLGSAEVAAAVAAFLRDHCPAHLVIDPVLRSSSGADLIDAKGLAILKQDLLALADVITPNIEEAVALSEIPVADAGSAQLAGIRLLELGARNVVVTGGHFASPDDLLVESGDTGPVFTRFPGKRIDTPNTHGTGCAFSTSLACHLALGISVRQAVAKAKEFVALALGNSFATGKGPGPVNPSPLEQFHG